jgi:ATP-dependent helicase HrpB
MANLPIESCLDAIVAALPPGGTLLLQAPPGAGKTTRVPRALLEAWGGNSGTILMLEPRRLAAKAAAERLASSLAEPVGRQVGYRVRFEQRCSAATRIEVVTDGLFLRRLQADPALEGVACVIFDEFHERRSEADLALALVREARTVLAPDLRLLVMSATLNLAPLASQWPEAQQVTSEGRSFAVAVSHQAPRPLEPLASQVVRALEQHWLDQRQPQETVLVFLPGQREILQCLRALEARDWAQELELCPLHGNLPLVAQSQALAGARRQAGKVVLASGIAESSLTLQGVTLVIDSGLSRRNRFDPRTGMDALVTGPASQASAEQRRGRAGRLGPGRCVRLWSAADQQGRPAFDPPELLEADPAPLVLQLAQWGAGLGEALPWLDPPPRANLQEGQALLQTLGAVDGAGALTGHGRQLAGLGVHPRLGQLLLRSRALGVADLGCALATLLSERDPLNPQSDGSDLGRRLDWLRQGGRDPQRQRLLQLQQQLGAQLQALGPLEPPEPPSAAPGQGSPKGSQSQPLRAAQAPKTGPLGPDALAGELVAHAYPDWVALLRPGSQERYLTRGGRGAQLHPTDPLRGCEVLAIAHTDGAGRDCRIHLAMPLARASLDAWAAQTGLMEELVRWDPQGQRVRAERQRRLGALVLQCTPWSDPPPELVKRALLEGLGQDNPAGGAGPQGLQLLPWTPTSRSLQQRLVLAHQHLGDPWPDRSDGLLLESLESWLGDQLEGISSAAELQRLNLVEALWSGLGWELRRQLDQLLPESVPIPSGRLARLDYGSGVPVLAVKLQELFGCNEGPMVLDGRLPVSLQLLSPAGRPAAITSDLASFWRSGYRQVRADLRGRYPRHPWPEDPSTAQATALTKRRLAQAQE